MTMKFARITRETTTTPAPTIIEKIEALQAELTKLIEILSIRTHGPRGATLSR